MREQKCLPSVSLDVQKVVELTPSFALNFLGTRRFFFVNSTIALCLVSSTKLRTLWLLLFSYCLSFKHWIMRLYDSYIFLMKPGPQLMASLAKGKVGVGPTTLGPCLGVQHFPDIIQVTKPCAYHLNKQLHALPSSLQGLRKALFSKEYSTRPFLKKRETSFFLSTHCWV